MRKTGCWRRRVDFPASDICGIGDQSLKFEVSPHGLTAVILAAGSGSRFRRQGVPAPKQLLMMGGLSLLERSARSAARAGAGDIVIVLGYEAERIRAAVAPKLSDLRVRWVVLSDWEKGNGASLLAAKPYVGAEPFLVLMSDHLFLPGLLEGLVQARCPADGAVMAVDRKSGLLTDLDDAMKVGLRDNRVTEIGKGLAVYDAVDTGAALCTARIFAELESARAARPAQVAHRDAMSGLAEKGRLLAHDVGGARWEDVDEPKAQAAAELLLFESLRKPTDGFISRLLERRLSLAATKILCRTSLTPNQMTACVLVIGASAAFLFSRAGYMTKVAAALLFWCASFLDGCDGELARLKFQASRLGGILDFWSDNVIHMAVFAGIGAGLYRDTGGQHWLILGGLASLGTLLSAAWIYRKSVASEGRYSGVLVEPLEPKGFRGRLAGLADKLSRRDFIFWLVFIVMAGGLPYFIWAAAIGTYLYLAVVVLLHLSAAGRLRALYGLAAAAGLLLCGGLLWGAGGVAVLAHIGLVGWKFLLLAPISLTWMIPNTLGWAFAIPPGLPNVTFPRLFAARVSGEALNYILPSGYLGGEPAKAAILSSWTGAGIAMGSVALAKTTQTFGLLCFILAGLSLAARRPVPDLLKPLALAVPLLLAGGVLVMAFAASGLLSGLSRHLDGQPAGGVRSRLAGKLQAWEAAHADYCRKHKLRLATSTFWHFLGWTAGSGEIYFIAEAMGLSLSPDDAFLMASVVMLVAVGGFFIPGMLGAFEGGHLAAAAVVGLSPEAGMAIGMLRRLREIAWVGAGALLLGSLHRPIFTKLRIGRPAGEPVL